jgi:hypothetical protein
MMMAMFAAMYFGGLRPGEAAGLREKDCHLPQEGWGLLTLARTGRKAASDTPIRGDPRRTRAQASRGQGDATGTHPAGAGSHPA